MDIDIDQVGRSPWSAAALGSIVALKFAPGVTWAERCINVTAGSLIAGFLAPVAAEWLHITAPHLQSGLAFVIGLFGLSLTAAVMQGVRDIKLGEIVTGWIGRR